MELLLWPGAGKEVDEERKGDSVLFQASQVSQVSHLQVIEQQDADDTGISRLTFFVADCIEVEGPAQKGPPGVGGWFTVVLLLMSRSNEGFCHFNERPVLPVDV